MQGSGARMACHRVPAGGVSLRIPGRDHFCITPKSSHCCLAMCQSYPGGVNGPETLPGARMCRWSLREMPPGHPPWPQGRHKRRWAQVRENLQGLNRHRSCWEWPYMSPGQAAPCHRCHARGCGCAEWPDITCEPRQSPRPSPESKAGPRGSCLNSPRHSSSLRRRLGRACRLHASSGRLAWCRQGAERHAPQAVLRFRTETCRWAHPGHHGHHTRRAQRG